MRTQIENLDESTRQSLREISANKIWADLKEEFLEKLQADCIEIGYWDSISDQGHSEFVLFDWVNTKLSDVDAMIKELGYDSFQEWFLAYNETEMTQAWVREWTKIMATDFYNIFKGKNGKTI